MKAWEEVTTKILVISPWTSSMLILKRFKELVRLVQLSVNRKLNKTRKLLILPPQSKLFSTNRKLKLKRLDEFKTKTFLTLNPQSSMIILKTMTKITKSQRTRTNRKKQSSLKTALALKILLTWQLKKSSKLLTNKTSSDTALTTLQPRKRKRKPEKNRHHKKMMDFNQCPIRT